MFSARSPSSIAATAASACASMCSILSPGSLTSLSSIRHCFSHSHPIVHIAFVAERAALALLVDFHHDQLPVVLTELVAVGDQPLYNVTHDVGFPAQRLAEGADGNGVVACDFSHGCSGSRRCG